MTMLRVGVCSISMPGIKEAFGDTSGEFQREAEPGISKKEKRKEGRKGRREERKTT